MTQYGAGFAGSDACSEKLNCTAVAVGFYCTVRSEVPSHSEGSIHVQHGSNYARSENNVLGIPS